MKVISVVEARHVKAFALEIAFADGKKKTVDFAGFLKNHSHPQYNKYKKVNGFKQFHVENGNVVWGKNWDMIFPVHELYTGKIG